MLPNLPASAVKAVPKHKRFLLVPKRLLPGSYLFWHRFYWPANDLPILSPLGTNCAPSNHDCQGQSLKCAALQRASRASCSAVSSNSTGDRGRRGGAGARRAGGGGVAGGERAGSAEPSKPPVDPASSPRQQGDEPRQENFSKSTPVLKTSNVVNFSSGGVFF